MVSRFIVPRYLLAETEYLIERIIDLIVFVASATSYTTSSGLVT